MAEKRINKREKNAADLNAVQESTKSRKREHKALAEKLELKFPVLADVYDEDMKENADAFCSEYKSFLNGSKTERDAVKRLIEGAEELGYKPLRELSALPTGTKIYHNIKNKGLVLAVIGRKPAREGMRVLGAHIDSPRLDLKPQPLQEDSELVYFRTHYYGGIKNYQWAAIPLALHGVAHRGDGQLVEMTVGEKADDPKFTVSDLLPHLGRVQMAKNAKEVIPAEALNLIIGSKPMPGDDKSRFKLETLNYLYETYGLIERDFCSAELTAVPAGEACDIGFDRLLIGAYGQDDKVCAFPAVRALFDMEKPEYTSICLLSDKEEIGSDGNSGAKSRLYENVLAEIYEKQTGAYTSLGFRRALENTAMLSADVVNAYDPNFAAVSDLSNSNYLGHGISLCKYTGSGGKYGASDADAEFVSAVCCLYDREKIYWQTGEMGKIDAGGGGTIAKYFAQLGMEVLDCGVPVLSMHSPFELSHKYDVYETYRAYACFLKHF